MRVIVYDPNVNPERIEQSGFASVSLEELYKESDYITVHVPKIKKTVGMLNKDAFARMKDGVMIINCARGGVIDENDLCDALKSGKVGGAALDVFAVEPPGESPLLAFDNLICTPHLGASTKEAQTNVAVDVANQIVAYLTEGTIINAVNAPSVIGEKLKKLKPFLDLAERIGRLQAQIIQGKLKEVTVEYSGDFSGLQMEPVTTALLNGLLDPLVTDTVNAVNAPAIAQEMGIRVSETASAEPCDFVNLMTVRVTTTDGDQIVGGTVYGKAHPRIVRINDFRIDLSPGGAVLMILTADKPGDIGRVGTILGEAGVTVSSLAIGQKETPGDTGMILVKTGKAIPDAVVDKLKKQESVIAVTPVLF